MTMLEHAKMSICPIAHTLAFCAWVPGPQGSGLCQTEHYRVLNPCSVLTCPEIPFLEACGT